MTKYLNNALWAVVDKFFVLFGSLIAYVLVSRHLGPEELGKITFGVAISALGVTLSQWGANHTIFNTTIKNKYRSRSYIYSTSKSRFSIYIVFWMLSSLCVYFINSNLYDVALISMVIFSHIFLAMDVYQFYLDGSLMSKINARSNFVARFFSTVTRLVFVVASLNVYWFVIPFFINNALLYLIRKRKVPKPKYYSDKKFEASYFFLGRYFVLSGVFAFIYTKINEIFLATFSGFESSGALSVAITLGFAFTFIPTALGTTYLNKALSSKNSDNCILFSFVNSIMIAAYCPVILVLYFLGEDIVLFLLGNEYEQIGSYVWVLSIVGLLSSLGVINNKIIGNFPNGSKYLFHKVVLSSFISIPISYFMILELNLEGAIYSLVIIEILSLTLFNYLFNKGMVLKVHVGIIKSHPVLIYNYLRG
ncbi:oligosaccharide flippase family protein [Vibrio splendidus]